MGHGCRVLQGESIHMRNMQVVEVTIYFQEGPTSLPKVSFTTNVRNLSP
jgi:hypothetical protein